VSVAINPRNVLPIDGEKVLHPEVDHIFLRPDLATRAETKNTIEPIDNLVVSIAKSRLDHVKLHVGSVRDVLLPLSREAIPRVEAGGIRDHPDNVKRVVRTKLAMMNVICEVLGRRHSQSLAEPTTRFVAIS
jgi:hypothetical protein